MRLCASVITLLLVPFANLFAQECTLDTSKLNVSLCSPKADDYVPTHLTVSFSAYSPGPPITQIFVSSQNTSVSLQPNQNSYQKDVTLDITPILEPTLLIVKMWNANGDYAEASAIIHVRKTVDVCPAPAENEALNFCTPSTDDFPTSPMKVVAIARSANIISHIKVYVDDFERYSADDDEVYTRIPVTAGLHKVAVVAWNSHGETLQETRTVKIAEACPAMVSGSGVEICQPEQNSTSVGSLRFSARSHSDGPPITYMRLYRGAQPVWQGPFQNIETDLHGLPAGTFDYGLVAWNANGQAFTDVHTATVTGFLSPPTCAIPDTNQTVDLCYPGPGDFISNTNKVWVSARARWDGLPIQAMRIYVDYQPSDTIYQPRNGNNTLLYQPITLSSGTHKIVVVAWNANGDPMVSEERVVTVQ